MLKTEDLVTVTFGPGETLFKKGDRSNDCAYIIKNGCVNIMSMVGSQSVLIDRLGRGDFVGEMALIDDEPRSASAIAAEETICTIVTKEEIDKALGDADLLAYALVRTLSKRLRKTTERADLFFDE